MSISQEIVQAVPEVDMVNVTKTDLHGEDAVQVKAYFKTGGYVEGTFAKHPKEGFGGVVFRNHKDIPGLMIHKINSVLRGTAE